MSLLGLIAQLISVYGYTRGFPGDSGGKESACNVGDLGSILGLERYPGGGHGNPPAFLSGDPPWAEGSDRARSRGSQRVEHDGVTFTFTFMDISE